MSEDKLSIRDERNGREYDLGVTHGTLRALDLRQIKTGDDDFGLMSYDPGFTNTAAAISRITYIDGEKGVLRYRGYPIEVLAEKSGFLETAYLLLTGELPTASELDEFDCAVRARTLVHENIRELVDAFRYDAHPMGILVSTVGALSTFYPEAKDIRRRENREKHMVRLIAKMPTIAAYAYRHRCGLPYVYPDPDLSFSANFLSMMFKRTEVKYKPNPIVERALDVLFILHADHEQNCSTSTMRMVGSSLADPYSATAAACAALYGPRHGGANEAVVSMLKEIGDKSQVAPYLDRVKAGELKLMGFGHRVYKNYDPRAKVIKQLAYDLFDAVGHSPLIDLAVELESRALQDDYFRERRLFPNVDFYSGVIYEALKIPVDMFPVMFAIGRTPGWLAHWEELVNDPEQRIARPRQVYLGPGQREYVDMRNR